MTVPRWDPTLVDGYLTITDEEAIHWARELASREGLFAGFASSTASQLDGGCSRLAAVVPREGKATSDLNGKELDRSTRTPPARPTATDGGAQGTQSSDVLKLSSP
jgi:hypothetical protein